MNKVILMGRLTRDPEVRYAQDNMAVARFSIAVDRRFKRDGQPDADFFNCTAFSKTAEFVEKFLKKGTKIALSGSLQNDNYTDKNGIQRYDIRVIVEEIEFAESKNTGSDTPEAPAKGKEAEQKSKKPSKGKKAEDEFINIPDGIDEELPFS